MSEWQDISTAPKDGDTIIGWEPYCLEPVTVKWSGHQKRWVSSWENSEVLEYMSDFGSEYKSVNPTHWQPLPTAPTNLMGGR